MHIRNLFDSVREGQKSTTSQLICICLDQCDSRLKFLLQFFSTRPYWRLKPTEIIASDYTTTFGAVTTKGFITAGKDQNSVQIALSFFATAMGARTVTIPAFYASYAGWLGLLFYALSCGVPIILIGLIGPAVRRRWPEACSLGDFIHYRCTPPKSHCP